MIDRWNEFNIITKPIIFNDGCILLNINGILIWCIWPRLNYKYKIGIPIIISAIK